jgi:hypothetical protein
MARGARIFVNQGEFTQDLNDFGDLSEIIDLESAQVRGAAMHTALGELTSWGVAQGRAAAREIEPFVRSDFLIVCSAFERTYQMAQVIAGTIDGMGLLVSTRLAIAGRWPSVVDNLEGFLHKTIDMSRYEYREDQDLVLVTTPHLIAEAVLGSEQQLAEVVPGGVYPLHGDWENRDFSPYMAGVFTDHPDVS